jgi:hypothetical protein
MSEYAHTQRDTRLGTCIFEKKNLKYPIIVTREYYNQVLDFIHMYIHVSLDLEHLL